MNVKNVVKVMNFHSLLRVDRSRKSAKTYAYLGDTVSEMIDNIVNNRNIMLDYKFFRVNEEMPVLNIYLGGDMGFCGNLNSSVNRQVWADENAYKIIIGKKIRASKEDDKVLISMTRESFKEDNSYVLEILKDAFLNKKYSKINLIYNHYYNSSELEFMVKQLFPMPKHLYSENNYQDDFAYEGDIETILTQLVLLYFQYELSIAFEVSSAALNITRQNSTTESLKRIDEREEMLWNKQIRETREKEFGKVLDNYTKLNRY
jgi:ATP synthase F1 gamma subunit